MTARTTTSHPYDVCFSFDSGHEIWEDSGFLKEASPYWASLPSSSFAEGTPLSKKRRVQTPSKVVTAKKESSDFDDSDAEGDGKVGPPEKDPATCDKPIHQVKVTSSSYITYRAVLCYLRTSYISFSPLSSLSAEAATRGGSDTPFVVGDRAYTFTVGGRPLSTSVPSVSPKSVYRLAHLLEHVPLQQLALDQLSCSLTPDMAATELFGDVAKAYHEVYKLEMEYVAEYWSKVQDSAAMRLRRW